jgi:hypothetical protein
MYSCSWALEPEEDRTRGMPPNNKFFCVHVSIRAHATVYTCQSCLALVTWCPAAICLWNCCVLVSTVMVSFGVLEEEYEYASSELQ